ncbi:hypothetical protein [Psychrobacillus lasiicapitis]|uniref:Uncharacterized protein n=1 Tax=Psychrobacillus lasiicapitis TaxID=1636719 RepID=A0A544SS03_9BACI|nr:hypothetical protein [Psychrobacillus lasiicapitis]TQR07994.1 hypothetical protein FG382_21955 [Psychrobacillus lasiicapitis]GGA49829.1 hypothetical protein GCM10011384_44370 [Psychrobacillus lasiicapitis]
MRTRQTLAEHDKTNLSEHFWLIERRLAATYYAGSHNPKYLFVLVIQLMDKGDQSVVESNQILKQQVYLK